MVRSRIYPLLAILLTKPTFASLHLMYMPEIEWPSPSMCQLASPIGSHSLGCDVVVAPRFVNAPLLSNVPSFKTMSFVSFT